MGIETLEGPRCGTEKDGRRYMHWDVGDWSVYVGETAVNADRFEVLLLPASYSQKILKVHAGTLEECAPIGAAVVVTLRHIGAQGLRIPADDLDMIGSYLVDGE